MGFLGKIGQSIMSAVKPLAMQAIKAVAPKAIDMLKNIVGSGFDKLASSAMNLVGRLPGPFGSLAQKLLGSAIPGLKGMAEGGIEKLLKGLLEKLNPQKLENGTSVTAPQLQNRDLGAELAQATSAIASAPRTIASAAAAATNGVSASSVGGGVAATAVSQAGYAGDNSLTTDQKAMLNGLKEPELGRQTATLKVQNYQESVAFISNILKKMNEIQMSIINNLR
jgi:hypothetical protein